MTSPVLARPEVRSSRGAFAALLCAVLSFSLLQTMVIPALPDLRAEFHTSSSVMAWVLSAFLLTSSVGTVLLGRLGDMVGKKRMMLVSLAILGLGTLMSALAFSAEMLIAGRAVQGLGAATFPLAFGLVRDIFHRDQVPVAIGTISAVFGIGFGVGLVIPGPLLDHLGWQWIFWVSLIAVAIAFAAVAASITETPVRRPGRIDWPGAILVTAGLAAVLLAISQARAWTLPAIAALLGCGAVALVVFVMVERRASEPLIDLSMLGRRPVLGANLVALLIGFGLYGAFSLVPQFVQTPTSAGYGFGATPTESGLFLLPMALTMLVAGPVAGWLGARSGSKRTLVAACTIGVAGFAVIAAGLDCAWIIATGAGIIGVGVGFSFSSVVNLVVSAVEPNETGQATAVNTIVRTLGGSLGAQAAPAIVTSTLATGTSFPAESGYTTAFIVSAVVMAAAALVLPVVGIPGRGGMARRRRNGSWSYPAGNSR
ncbi:MFS transporter [Nonomuraea sp. MTCD27]|uniref:MFS transporter n=1 Tax=Nonomuraea sp. MTCD27 TaxID=1676747 RepID=UPI0035C1182C